MTKPSPKVLTHTLVAVGAGLGVFLGKVAEITTNPYVQAACVAGVTTLALLGGGLAKRAAP